MHRKSLPKGAGKLGILSGLQSDPQGTLIRLCYLIPAILIALTLHELAHGYVAYRCGDPTAMMLGRLSFNPLKHLDPIGTLFMVLFGFGWARPVPINSRNFKRFRRDELLVALAGVTVNFLLFFFTLCLMVGVNQLAWSPDLWTKGALTAPRSFLSMDDVNYYYVLSGENYVAVDDAEPYILYSKGNSVTLSPFTPEKYLADDMSIVYDGEGNEYFVSNDLMDYARVPWLLYVQRFLMYFSMINLSLCIFNLLPIPPLDGYHVVNDIFLRGKLHIPENVLRVLMVALLIFMWSTSYISTFISNAVSFVQGGVLSGVLAVFGLG